MIFAALAGCMECGANGSKKAEVLVNRIKQGLKDGQDECADCNDDCNTQYNACGYAQVHNDGGYVAKFCVDGQLDTGDHFCCSSGSFTLGETEAIDIPCNSTQLLLRAEEDVFIDSWSIVGLETYTTPNVTVCYEMKGTTLNPSWEQVNC